MFSAPPIPVLDCAGPWVLASIRHYLVLPVLLVIGIVGLSLCRVVSLGTSDKRDIIKAKFSLGGTVCGQETNWTLLKQNFGNIHAKKLMS